MEENFWKGFFSALDSRFEDRQELQGASGIKHQVLGLGIDEENKRLIVVQNEQDARILSMAQADIQSRIKDYNVLMVRPVPINLSTAFSKLATLFGSSILNQKDFKEITEEYSAEEIVQDNKSDFVKAAESISPQIKTIQKTELDLVPIAKELIFQLSHLEFINGLNEGENFSLDFKELIEFNPIIYDTAVGVCPIPLYEFSIEETESFIKESDYGRNKHILKKHNIEQFFRPPTDSLALGLIERENYKKDQLIENMSKVPNFGHPYGENEIIEINEIPDVVESLKDKGYIVEGELNLGITEEAREKRMSIKFSPRESIFERLSKVFSVKVNLSLKDFFNS